MFFEINFKRSIFKCKFYKCKVIISVCIWKYVCWCNIKIKQQQKKKRHSRCSQVNLIVTCFAISFYFLFNISHNIMFLFFFLTEISFFFFSRNNSCFLFHVGFAWWVKCQKIINEILRTNVSPNHAYISQQKRKKVDCEKSLLFGVKKSFW